MTATGHALVGTALAVSISNPIIGIPLAFVSHVACDLIPHWDTGTNRKHKTHTRFFIESIIDLMLSFVLPYLIVTNIFPQTNLAYLFIMIISAQLIDWLTVPYLFLKMTYFPFNIPYKLQLKFDNRLDKPWGIIYQALAVLICLSTAYFIYYN